MIWARTPIHVDAIVQRLLAGDRATAIFVGLPTEKFLGKPMAPVDDATKEYVRPLVERAGLVTSINEAWALLGAITLLSLIVLAVVLYRTRQKKSAPELPRTRLI
jgi:DHA2 family multidrug resistance protein